MMRYDAPVTYFKFKDVIPKKASKDRLSLSGNRHVTMFIFLGLLLEYRATDQIYLFVTRNTSSAKHGNQELHLIKQSDWLWMALLIFRITDR